MINVLGLLLLAPLLQGIPIFIIFGTVTIEATVVDNSGTGIAAVQFYRGATSLGAVAVPPFNLTWDTRSMTDGIYAITATATNNLQQTSSSDVVLVLINNSMPEMKARGKEGR